MLVGISNACALARVHLPKLHRFGSAPQCTGPGCQLKTTCGLGFLHTSYIQLVCSCMGILGNREKSLRNLMDQGIPGVQSWSSRFVSDFSLSLATNESVLTTIINDPRCTGVAHRDFYEVFPVGSYAMCPQLQNYDTPHAVADALSSELIIAATRRPLDGLRVLILSDWFEIVRTNRQLSDYTVIPIAQRSLD